MKKLEGELNGGLNEFVALLGERKQCAEVRLSSARESVERGLRYFVGDQALWLQGYDDVVSWLSDNRRKGLLLYGANGRGKSVLCKYVIPTLLEYYCKRLKVYNVRAIDLRYLQPDNNEYYAMKRADVLVVDDFGIEPLTSVYGEKRDVFSDVVDIAEHERKLLVCSTNLVPEEIGKRYGLRTLDRLRALTHPVCFVGPSLRGSVQSEHDKK